MGREAVLSVAVMFAVAGALALVGSFLPLEGTADAAPIRLLGVADLFVAAVLVFGGAERYHAVAVLTFVSAAALAIIFLFEAIGALPQVLMPVFFIALFLWVGLHYPPRTATWLCAAALPVFLGALAFTDHTVPTIVSFAVAIIMCTVVAEIVARSVWDLRNSQHSIQGLLETALQLQKAGDVEAAAETLAEATTKLVGPDLLVVWTNPELGSNKLVGLAQRGVDLGLDDLIIDMDRERSAVEYVFQRNEATFIEDTTRSDLVNVRLVRLTGAVSALYLPLSGPTRPVGAISAFWRAPHAEPEPMTMRSLQVLSREGGEMLERLLRTAELAREAASDPLTGLPNRRSFQRALDKASAGDAIALLDLDHFKRINDLRGHPAGDQVLRDFGRCLRSRARTSDLVSRFGGEEFGLVLAQPGDRGVQIALDRFRDAWRQTKPEVTYSAGVAFRRENEGPALTLGRADAALYRAKEAGRDRFVIDRE